MPVIKVDPEEFLTASQLVGSANHGGVDAITALVGVLSGSAGMAGSDTGGQQWAKTYDEAAASLVDAGAGIANALGTASQLLSATGNNHADAEAASTPGSGSSGGAGGFAEQSSGLDYYGGGTSTSGGVESIAPAAPPSANGGSKDEPHGWFLIEHLLQYTWPNGHQDKLRAAGSAWQAAAESFTEQANLLPSAISTVNAQQTPEAPDAVQQLQDFQSGLTELSSGFAGLAGAANDYAAHLDDAHHEIISELESLLAWTIASEATGALLTVFTAGISDAAAQAAVAARCAAAAARVGGIIGRLIETVGTLVQRIVNFAAKAIEIGRKAKEFAAAQASAAATAVAARLPGAASAAKAAEVAAQSKYADYVARMAAKGKTPKSFERWQQLAANVTKNKAVGDARRDAVFKAVGGESKGWTRESSPQGSGRFIDVANPAALRGIEVKSGTTPVAEGLTQLAKDEQLVAQAGWQIEWRLAKPLAQTLMKRLDELVAKYPGDFTYTIG